MENNHFLLGYEKSDLSHDVVGFVREYEIIGKVYVILMFNSKSIDIEQLNKFLEDLKDFYLPAGYGSLVMFPQDFYMSVIKILEERVGITGFSQVDIPELNECIINSVVGDLRGLLESSVSLSSFDYNPYVYNNFKFRRIEMKETVDQVWDQGGYKRRMILQAYILQKFSKIEGENLQKTIQERMGLSNDAYKIVFRELQSSGIFEEGFVVQIRKDNQVFKNVETLVQAMYHPDQTISYIDNGKEKDISGLELIEMSYKGQNSSQLAKVIKGFLDNYFQNVKSEMLDHNQEIFNLHFKGTWNIVISCRTRHGTLNRSHIANALTYKFEALKKHSNVKTENEVAVLIGPAFEIEAEDVASATEVKLMDIFSLLQLVNFMQNNKNKSMEIEKSFYKLFGSSGAFVSIQQAIPTIFET